VVGAQALCQADPGSLHDIPQRLAYWPDQLVLTVPDGYGGGERLSRENGDGAPGDVIGQFLVGRARQVITERYLDRAFAGLDDDAGFRRESEQMRDYREQRRGRPGPHPDGWRGGARACHDEFPSYRDGSGGRKVTRRRRLRVMRSGRLGGHVG
jgi:hypothetical protein